MKNKYGKRPPQCVVREEGERQNARGTMLNAKHYNEGDDGPNKLDSRQRQRNAASDAPIGEEDSSVNDLHETDYRSARRVLTQSHNGQVSDGGGPPALETAKEYRPPPFAQPNCC